MVWVTSQLQGLGIIPLAAFWHNRVAPNKEYDIEKMKVKFRSKAMTFQQNSAPALSQPPYLTFLPLSSSLRQLTIPTVPLGSPDTIHRLVLAWLPRAASLSRKGRTHSVPKPDISIKFSSAERHDNWEMIVWKSSHFSSFYRAIIFQEVLQIQI